MIGKEKEPGDGFLYNFRLSKRIPQDHSLRKLRKILDLDFLYSELKDRYGQRGNVSVPPPVLMKMMLLLVLYNVRSERELMRTIPLRLDWIWFLGYDLDDEIPHHSVLSKARKRWGEEIFEDFFKRILFQSIESGLVDGEKLFIDASLVEADASNNSIKRFSQMELMESYKEFSRRLDEKGKVSKSSKNKDDGSGQPKGGKHSVVNKEKKSTTDPDSSIVSSGGKPKLYYKVHRGIDEMFEIITSCRTTPGMVNEAHVLPDHVNDFRETFCRNPSVVIGDGKYGTKYNFIDLIKQGIRPHLNDLASAQEKSGSRQDKFHRDEFRYDRKGDFFECPVGVKLKRRAFNPNRKWFEYKAPKGTCDRCQLRSQCTTAEDGRSLRRDPLEELLEKGRAESKSQSGVSSLKKRQHLMERSYATAKRYGYKRARWRSLWRISIQQYLVASVQNLLKIMKYAGDPGSERAMPKMKSLNRVVYKIIPRFFITNRILVKLFAI